MIRGLGKFLIFKNDDLDKYLTEDQESALYDIAQTVDAGRLADGKVHDNHYLVINQDEVYADDVKDTMRQHGHWDY